METTPGKPLLDYREHWLVTLGDLAALIAGIALVLVLPTRQSYWPLPSDFLGPWPRWLPWFFCLRQALGAACVALVPVVLRRRASYGGLARAAEFLALCAAIPFLADSIETALMRLSFRLRGHSPPGFGLQGMPTVFVAEWGKSSHWVWEQALLLCGALALVGFLLGRRKLPGWLLTVLLTMAWLGAYEAGPKLALQWVVPLISHVNGRPIGETISVLIWAVVDLLPRFVLYSVPAIAAVRDVRRDGSAGPTWLEWTGLGLAAVLFLIAESTELLRYYSVTGGTGSWAVETLVREVTLVAAVIIGLFLVRFVQGNASRIESGHSQA